MEYKIVYIKYRPLNSGIKELEEKITELIKEGWQVQGGVSITTHTDFSFTLAQAMVKHPTNTKY